MGSDTRFNEISDINLLPLPNQFFVDFGDSDSSFMVVPTEDRDINNLIATNRRNFPGNHSQYHYTINGILVSVYSFGIHRAMHVQLPDNPDQKAQDAYNEAYKAACDLKPNDYKFYKNNCVTAVAKVLNKLDPTIDPTSWVPFWQYSHLNNQIRTLDNSERGKATLLRQPPSTLPMIKAFMRNYKGRYWRSDNQPRSFDELIEHAMGKHPGYSGKKTRDTLLALKWLTKDTKTGLFIPLPEFTPNMKQFNDALTSYNKSFGVIDCIKDWYKAEGGGLRAMSKIFNGKDIHKIIEILFQRSILNPGGASERTYAKLITMLNDETKSKILNLNDTTLPFQTSVSFNPEMLKARMQPQTGEAKINVIQLVQLLQAGRKDYSTISRTTSNSLLNVSMTEWHEIKNFLDKKLNLKDIKLSQSVFNLLLSYDVKNFSGANLTGIDLTIISSEGLDRSKYFTTIIAKNVICDSFIYGEKTIDSKQFIEIFKNKYLKDQKKSGSWFFSKEDPLSIILNDKNRTDGTKIMAIISSKAKNNPAVRDAFDQTFDEYHNLSNTYKKNLKEITPSNNDHNIPASPKL